MESYNLVLGFGLALALLLPAEWVRRRRERRARLLRHLMMVIGEGRD